MTGSVEESLQFSSFSLEWAKQAVVEQSCGLTASCECSRRSKTSCTSLMEAAAILLQVGTIRDGSGGGEGSAICILTDPVSRFPGQTSTKAPPG